MIKRTKLVLTLPLICNYVVAIFSKLNVNIVQLSGGCCPDWSNKCYKKKQNGPQTDLKHSHR